MASDTAYALKHYGDPNGKAFQSTYMVLYTFPLWLAAAWPRYQGKAVTKQWVNKDIIGPLEAVFKGLIATNLHKELKTFDGLWNIRLKRGINEYSIHSWGCAMDFNAAANPLNVKLHTRPGMFSDAFLAVWRKHGWTPGADFSRPDCMHFQRIASYGKTV